MNEWNKKSAVALSRAFFETLPTLNRVAKHDATVAWFVYDLIKNDVSGQYELSKVDEVFTMFDDALVRITTTKAGSLSSFLGQLQAKLDEKMESTPVNRLIDNPFSA